MAAAGVALTLALGGAGCGGDDSGGSGDGATAGKAPAAERRPSPATMDLGARVFEANCHACHTLGGEKHTKPPVEGVEAPNLDQVRPTLAKLKERIELGGIQMPGFGGVIPPRRTAALVAYLREVTGRDVGERPQGAIVDRGEQVFGEHCATCHPIAGEKATGKHVFPGTDFNELRPSAGYTAKIVRRGWAGLMPDFKGKLSDDEIAAVAAYVSSIAGEDEAGAE